jgi:hypothetical protein
MGQHLAATVPFETSHGLIVALAPPLCGGTSGPVAFGMNLLGLVLLPDIRELSSDKQSLLDLECDRLLACVRSLRTCLFARKGLEL